MQKGRPAGERTDGRAVVGAPRVSRRGEGICVTVVVVHCSAVAGVAGQLLARLGLTEQQPTEDGQGKGGTGHTPGTASALALGLACLADPVVGLNGRVCSKFQG